ncbi:MAG: asparagine synthase (glutamine-hydrolyzing) [Nitrospiria bacterium]
MCGIVGALVFNNNSFVIDPSYINRMRDVMVHRGPDGGGLWIRKDGKVALGHRRLSIIDLSNSASQPMSNEDGTLWVSFNGEIYNHEEIRKELEKSGRHLWKTDHSDTEVILHAFEEWGIDCLHRFRGMFAIALWDERNRELWLIRDRIGEKPLYYAVHHGRIVFASEIKALLQDVDQKRKVNLESFYHFLSFLTSPAPHTLFEGINKLPGGTWLKIKESGEIQTHRYWEVWDYTRPLNHLSEDEIAEMLISELRTSVKLRKVSDVPVGIFLSGGLDSSTNAALFSEGENRRIKTFSIGYKGDYQSYRNELDYARLMAERVGSEHYERLLTMDDLLEFLPRMVYLQDEPIADPVCVPVYYVSKLAKDHGVTVCQVGEGADELFWGYPWWKTALQVQKYDDLPIPRILKKCALGGLSLLGRRETYYYEWLRRGAEGQPVFWGGADVFSETGKQSILSDNLRKHFRGFTSWEAIKPIRQRFLEKAWEKSTLHWMTYLDLNVRLPELLLMRVDKMSMGVSLEGRVPFLDHKFVELALSISEKTKTRGGVLKSILKKSVRGLIPDEIIDRKKQGFGVPVYEWFFDRLGDTIRTELNEFCDQTDFFDRRGIMNLFDKGHGPQLWHLLNFSLWWKEFIK